MDKIKKKYSSPRLFSCFETHGPQVQKSKFSIYITISYFKINVKLNFLIHFQVYLQSLQVWPCILEIFMQAKLFMLG